MTQIAVFDAINAFDGNYTSYSTIASAEAGASLEVAIAYAAHDVLTDIARAGLGLAVSVVLAVGLPWVATGKLPSF